MNKYPGIVLRVIDGDTFETLIELGFGVSQTFKIRLLGIDTPEITGSSKKQGLAVKDQVEKLISGKMLYFYDEGCDKFGGRRLARVETEQGDDLTEQLISKGLGVPYDGGKKIVSILACENVS